MGQPTAFASPLACPSFPTKNSNPFAAAFFTVNAENTAVIRVGIGPMASSSPVNPSVKPCTKSKAPDT